MTKSPPRSSTPSVNALRSSALTLIVLSVAASACNGSIYRPTGVPRMAATRIVAFGDSITLGVIPSCGVGIETPQSWKYPSVLQTDFRDRYVSQMSTVTNRGVGGEVVEGGLRRLDSVLLADHPQVLLLQEGANDVNQGRTPTQIAVALGEMVRTARTRGVQVYLGTLLPQRVGGCRALGPQSIAPTNEQIRDVARAEGATLVDLYQAFGGAAGDLIGMDGLHPSEAGYRRISDTFSLEVRRQLED